MMKNQQLEMEEFHALPSRLRDAVTFIAKKMPKVNAMATATKQNASADLEKCLFFRSVYGVGAGPLTLWMVIRGKPESAPCETVGPLDQRGAASTAFALALALRLGGFGDVLVAVRNERYEGVTLRLTGDEEDDVEVFKFHPAPRVN
jgi:hypothetical protein